MTNHQVAVRRQQPGKPPRCGLEVPRTECPDKVAWGVQEPRLPAARTPGLSLGGTQDPRVSGTGTRGRQAWSSYTGPPEQKVAADQEL